MIKKYVALFLVGVFMTLIMACPSKITLEKAKIESGKLATYANAATDAVRAMFENKILSASQTKPIAEKIVILSNGGIAFDNFITALQTQYGSIDKVPKSEWNKALIIFNTQVVNAFIGLLNDLKFIKDVNTRMREVIDLIILSIRIIARAFGTETAITAQINSVL